MSVPYHEVHQDARLMIGSFPVFTGENSLSAQEIELCIKQALDGFNLASPRRRTVTKVIQPGEENQLYFRLTEGDADEPSIVTNQTLMDAGHILWDDDFSEVHEVWNAGNSDNANALTPVLDRDIIPTAFDRFTDFKVFREDDPTTAECIEYLSVYGLTKAQYDEIRLTYTLRHRIMGSEPPVADIGVKPNPTAVPAVTGDGRSITIAASSKTALTYLTVSLMAALAMIRAEKALDPPSGREFVTMRDKSKGFRTISDTYRELYIREMGGEDTPAACSFQPMAAINNIVTVSQVVNNHLLFRPNPNTRTLGGGTI